MSDKRQAIAVSGLFATITVSVYMVVVQLNGQTTQVTGDFTSASAAEVRDAQGQVVLRGQFQLAEEEDDDVERKAVLGPTDGDADATGEAEVEFSKGASSTQEIEFAVRNVAPGMALTFVIDGVDVATATADDRGRAEVELDVRMPGGGDSR